MRDDVSSWLSALKCGVLRIGFGDEPRLIATVISAALGDGPDTAVIVPVPTDDTTTAAAVTNGVVDALNDLALSAWPRWFTNDGAKFMVGPGPEARLHNTMQVERLAERIEGLAVKPLHQMVRRAELGRWPMLERDAPFTLGLVARMVSVDDFIVVPCFEQSDAVVVQALLQALRHLTDEAQIRCVAAVRASLAPTLDAFAYHAFEFDTTGADAAIQDVQAIGKPNPNSPGEVLLAERLAHAPDLRNLFEYNRPVKTVLFTRHNVDLVWRTGRLVIEIDGWGHRLAPNYKDDRQRDFELIASGYIVLRFVHSEVVKDPAGTLEKIRRVVRRRMEDGYGENL